MAVRWRFKRRLTNVLCCSASGMRCVYRICIAHTARGGAGEKVRDGEVLDGFARCLIAEFANLGAV